LAGLLVARRLAGLGHKVLLLESGGLGDDADILNQIDDPASRYDRALTGRHRGYGGTSSRWGGRMIPICEHDFSARPHVGLDSWPLRLVDLDGYDGEIEDLFGIASGSHEDIPSESNARSRAFPTAEASLTPRWAKCPSFKNCNIATLLDGELRRSRAIEIWLDATVCGFELDRDAGRLIGVTARSLAGKEMSVRAERFVIAAGTIESTRLLLLLDAASEERAFARCKVLGRYFQDHLKAEVATIGRADPVATNRLFGYRFVGGTRRDLHLELAQAAQEQAHVASAFAYIAMNLAQSPLAELKAVAQSLQRRTFDLRATGRLSRSLGVMMKVAWWRLATNQLFVPPDIEFKLMACVEQLPKWSNRICLSQRPDRHGNRMARIEWEPSASDESAFRTMIWAIGTYWESAGFDRICPLRWSPAARNGLPLIIEQAEACAHPSGSTRMGTSRENSVVGPDLQCHDVANVGVVSASVFPSAGSANPTFTLMKMALWYADGLNRALRSPPVVEPRLSAA